MDSLHKVINQNFIASLYPEKKNRKQRNDRKTAATHFEKIVNKIEGHQHWK